jgi:hypothetical protein
MKIRRGETLRKVLRLRSGTTPINLTGSTFQAGVYRYPSTNIKVIVPSVQLAEGIVTLEVDPADTEAFPLASDLKIWCEWTESNGTKKMILWETLKVSRGSP